MCVNHNSKVTEEGSDSPYLKQKVEEKSLTKAALSVPEEWTMMVFSNRYCNTMPVARFFNLLSDLKVENNIIASKYPLPGNLYNNKILLNVQVI